MGPVLARHAWRFMSSYKSPKMGHKYRYPIYNPTFNYPWISKQTTLATFA